MAVGILEVWKVKFRKVTRRETNGGGGAKSNSSRTKSGNKCRGKRRGDAQECWFNRLYLFSLWWRTLTAPPPPCANPPEKRKAKVEKRSNSRNPSPPRLIAPYFSLCPLPPFTTSERLINIRPEAVSVRLFRRENYLCPIAPKLKLCAQVVWFRERKLKCLLFNTPNLTITQHAHKIYMEIERNCHSKKASIADASKFILG